MGLKMLDQGAKSINIHDVKYPLHTYAMGCMAWQERQDSNPRPSVLETDALTRLSYAPARDHAYEILVRSGMAVKQYIGAR